MRRPALLVAAATLLGAAHHSAATLVPAVPPADLVEAAFSSIGGRAAYGQLTGVRVAFARASYSVGQEPWLGADAPLGSVMDGIEFRDYQRPGLMTRYHLPNARPTFTRVFLRDSAAFLFDTVAGGFGSITPASGYAGMWRDDPIRLLRLFATARDADLRQLDQRTIVGRKAMGVEVRAGEDTVRLWVDATSRAPFAMERVESDPVQTSRVTRITFSGWVSAGPVRVPGSVVTTQNERLLEAQLITQALANPNFDSAFASVRKLPATAVGNGVTIVELAPGIFRAEGTPGGVPYNTLFARTADSVFIFDPPVDDRYAQTVIDSVRARFPTARARAFVVSHHHADHVSGARAAFATGMSAIASAELAEYVRGLGIAPGSRAPNGRRVTAVRDTLAVGSGPSRFVLYPVPTGHARGMMLAYFPEAKLLAEVDLAAGLPADRRDLYDFVTSRAIAVERLARMHGPVQPWTTFAQPFEKAAGK